MLKNLIHQPNYQNQLCDISVLSNHSERIKQYIGSSKSIQCSSIRVDLLAESTAQEPIREKQEMYTMCISNTWKEKKIKRQTTDV